jgi:hypothetical protein
MFGTLSKRKRNVAGRGPCKVVCPDPCPEMPVLPEQGGLMPVLYAPSFVTSVASQSPLLPATYTLNVVTTQWISKGVVFRFQVFPGLTYTYAQAKATTGAIVQFDLVVTTPIPPATVVVVAQTPTGTALWDYAGVTQYTATGLGISPGVFKAENTTLCWAYVPTPTGAWLPVSGQPMFAIGFSAPTEGDCPVLATDFPEAATAPNIPNQYSTSVEQWAFEYSVVFPYVTQTNVGDVCLTTLGIKLDEVPLYALGSWSSLRGIITQPWTIVQPSYNSVSKWILWKTDAETSVESTADVGPFIWAAMPGQLVPVYFRPLPQDINTSTTPLPTYPPAEAAFLVTAPLPPNVSIYFTADEWDAARGGFGPHNAGTGEASFVHNTPSFVWITGSCVVPAGTVVLFTNIGGATGAIGVTDAHASVADVGAAVFNTISGQAVTSLIVCGVWVDAGVGSARPLEATSFVTAVLSDQYAGDAPLLAPGITMPLRVFSGPAAYGLDTVIDNFGLPAPVQAPLINNSVFTQLSRDISVDPTRLPTFIGMATYRF